MLLPSLRPLVASALLSLVAACGGMPPGMGPGPNPYYDPSAPGGIAKPDQADGAKCDPKGCSDFCMNMRCVYDEIGIDKCMAVCTSRCGDAFFEDADAKQMKCVIDGGPDLSCEGPKACCREHFTGQLCSE